MDEITQALTAAQDVLLESLVPRQNFSKWPTGKPSGWIYWIYWAFNLSSLDERVDRSMCHENVQLTSLVTDVWVELLWSLENKQRTVKTVTSVSFCPPRTSWSFQISRGPSDGGRGALCKREDNAQRLWAQGRCVSPWKSDGTSTPSSQSASNSPSGDVKETATTTPRKRTACKDAQKVSIPLRLLSPCASGNQLDFTFVSLLLVVLSPCPHQRGGWNIPVVSRGRSVYPGSSGFQHGQQKCLFSLEYPHSVCRELRDGCWNPICWNVFQNRATEQPVWTQVCTWISVKIWQCSPMMQVVQRPLHEMCFEKWLVRTWEQGSLLALERSWSSLSSYRIFWFYRDGEKCQVWAGNQREIAKVWKNYQ